MQAEWKKQLEEAEAANRKTQTMLENRSAEVGELKLQLKSQLEANAKLEANLKDAKDNKPESKKLKRSKGKRKKPAKPS